MPVEIVHLVQRQIVDIAFYVFHREEMPDAVEVHAPVFETGIIADRHRPDDGQHSRPGRQHLDEALHAIEHTRTVISLDTDRFGSNREGISARGLPVFPVGKDDQILARIFLGQGQTVSEMAVEVVDEVLGRFFRLFVGCIHARCAGNGKLPLSGGHLNGFGDDVGQRSVLLLGGNGTEEQQEKTEESRSHNFSMFFVVQVFRHCENTA